MMKPGRCWSLQVGVNAPGMPTRIVVPLPSAWVRCQMSDVRCQMSDRGRHARSLRDATLHTAPSTSSRWPPGCRQGAQPTPPPLLLPPPHRPTLSNAPTPTLQHCAVWVVACDVRIGHGRTPRVGDCDRHTRHVPYRCHAHAARLSERQYGRLDVRGLRPTL